MQVKDAFELTKWLEINREDIERDLPTRADLTKQASENLGFKVTPPNLKICLAQAGIELPNKRGGGASRLKIELQETKNLLLDVIAAATGFDENYLRDFLADENVPMEIKDAMRLNPQIATD